MALPMLARGRWNDNVPTSPSPVYSRERAAAQPRVRACTRTMPPAAGPHPWRLRLHFPLPWVHGRRDMSEERHLPVDFRPPEVGAAQWSQVAVQAVLSRVDVE